MKKRIREIIELVCVYLYLTDILLTNVLKYHSLLIVFDNQSRLSTLLIKLQ